MMMVVKKARSYTLSYYLYCSPLKGYTRVKAMCDDSEEEWNRSSNNF